MWIDRRWLMAGLALSLLANIFLVGVVTGHVFSERKAQSVPHGRPVVRLAQRRLLPPDEKKRFTAVMRAHRAVIEARRKDLRAAKRAAESAIALPTYDRAKVEAAFAAVRRTVDASQEATQAALAEALGTLSPEARKTLVAPN